jgi:uncharacterized membrane protein YgaE (UPF0421/DUF939 family)
LKIGYRTIKTAIGTAISVFIAQQLGLHFYASAGIITILCIQATRKQSVITSLKRIFACLVGLLFGFLFFAGLGFHPLSLMLLLLLFIPVTVRLNIAEGFITSVVVLLHLYSLEYIDFAVIGNELALLFIGVAVALLINLYMPNIDKELKRLREAVENNFSIILKEFAHYLRRGGSDWDGKEMIETPALLDRAKHLALQDVENRFLRRENTLYQYFLMREKQFELLERMLPIVSSLHLQVPQGEQIADFLENLSNRVHSGNTAYIFLDKLKEMRQEIQKTPLPQTREEFEIRASLFYLLHEIEQYLFIKHNLWKTN